MMDFLTPFANGSVLAALGLLALAAGLVRHLRQLRLLMRLLAARESQLQAILDNAPVPIFFKDCDGRFRLINRCYEQWFRKGTDETLGRTVAELYPDRDMHQIEDSDRIVVEHGTVTYLRDDMSHVTYGIEAMEVTKFPIHDRNGRLIGIGGLAMDITERRRAEKALLEKEERYRALIEHSNDIVGVVDRDGFITYRNAPDQDPLGYAPGEELGHPLMDFIHPEDAPEVQQALQSILCMPGRRQQGVHRYRCKGGSYRQMAWSARNAADVPGIGGIIVNARDVTAMKELEAQLLQSRKMEAVGQLAGGIAHDFNNILGGILGFAGFLVDDLPPDSAQRKFALRILQASERARDLVQQIVAFSRMSSVERKPRDLVEIIQDTRELLRPLLPSSTHLLIEHESAELFAEVNAGQMSQILVNLCINANDSLAGKPGSITIASTVIPPGHEDFALFVEHGGDCSTALGAISAGRLDPARLYARITVADTGHGIPADQLEHVFEPFYTTKERGRGTGLGLAVVHGTVMAYDGALAVTSRPERGTVFRIYLPLLTADAAAQDEPAVVALPVLAGRERILIVDDEPMITDMLAIGLGRLGYKVESRNDPQEALSLFASDPARWDVVISDEVMPCMRGSLLFTKLKAIDPALRFILCTGFSDRIGEETFHAAGMDAFFNKPASPEQLAAAIRHLVANQNRRAAIPLPAGAIP